MVMLMCSLVDDKVLSVVSSPKERLGLKSLVYETPVDTGMELVASVAVAYDVIRNMPGIFERCSTISYADVMLEIVAVILSNCCEVQNCKLIQTSKWADNRQATNFECTLTPCDLNCGFLLTNSDVYYTNQDFRNRRVPLAVIQGSGKQQCVQLEKATVQIMKFQNSKTSSFLKMIGNVVIEAFCKCEMLTSQYLAFQDLDNSVFTVKDWTSDVHNKVRGSRLWMTGNSDVLKQKFQIQEKSDVLEHTG
ncbi:hypothetical protein ANN_05997 [Periplaneta americana]|uniref:Uncharacterized protein n=1 Tax=Periplaneta americana TaxID=6978 RepID=A0ABQ8TCC4_PERAM|nr:hypothetical protein ANN_05997 [Periplaneta americana]